MKIDPWRKVLVLGVFAVLLFFAGNGRIDLTNPDEVFYAGTAKEMADHHTWLVPYLFDAPQFEKPILTYWLIRIAFIVFGMTAFAARFFPALFALLGVLGVYVFCVRVHGDRKKAFLCAMVLMSGGLYVGMARTVFTDMIFSVFIAFSLGAFYLGYIDRAWRSAGIVLFFAFSGLGVLTKGLLGAAMPLGAAGLFLLLRHDFKFLARRSTVVGVLVFLLLVLPWYFFMTMKFGRGFIDEFYVNDHIRRILEAEHDHNDTWYFYPATMLVCFFPWTLFVAAGFGYLFNSLKRREPSPFYVFLACWIAVPFLLVQVAHSKLVSYIFPVFPAVAIITGDLVRAMFIKAAGRARALAVGSLALLLCIPPLVLVLAQRHPDAVLHPQLLGTTMAVFLVFLIVQLVAVARHVRLFPYAAAVNLMFILFTCFMLAPDVNNFAASRNSGQFIARNYSGNSPVLCSKMIVRGVRYYSGKTVGVWKPGGGAFFSAHPIEFIDTPDKLIRFLNGRGPVYAVLEPKDLDAARQALQGRYHCRPLATFGRQTVITFELLK